jgi:hypothetical protein
LSIVLFSSVVSRVVAFIRVPFMRVSLSIVELSIVLFIKVVSFRYVEFIIVSFMPLKALSSESGRRLSALAHNAASTKVNEPFFLAARGVRGCVLSNVVHEEGRWSSVRSMVEMYCVIVSSNCVLRYKTRNYYFNCGIFFKKKRFLF